MADTHYLSKGDTLPILTATMTNSVGTPISLAGASGVLFQMWPATDLPSATAFTITRACTVIDPPNGVVTLTWQAGDTDAPGTYYCNFVVTWPGGAKQTIPNPGHDTVIIRDSQG